MCTIPTAPRTPGEAKPLHNLSSQGSKSPVCTVPTRNSSRRTHLARSDPKHTQDGGTGHKAKLPTGSIHTGKEGGQGGQQGRVKDSAVRVNAHNVLQHSSATHPAQTARQQEVVKTALVGPPLKGLSREEAQVLPCLHASCSAGVSCTHGALGDLDRRTSGGQWHAGAETRTRYTAQADALGTMQSSLRLTHGPLHSPHDTRSAGIVLSGLCCLHHTARSVLSEVYCHSAPESGSASGP